MVNSPPSPCRIRPFHEFHRPPQWPCQRSAARGHASNATYTRHAEGSVLVTFRRHPRAVHRQRRGSRPGVAARQGRRLGHRRIRHAAARHQHPHAARSRARRPGRTHDGNPAPDRPQPARVRRSQRARRAHDHARLRRAAGRRRHAHRRDHRRLRRAGRCGALADAARQRSSATRSFGAVAAVSVGIYRACRCSISTTPRTPAATPT